MDWKICRFWKTCTTHFKQPEPEAKNVLQRRWKHVTGPQRLQSQDKCGHQQTRLVWQDITLGKQLKKIGMLVVQDQVWGRVTENRSEGKSTRYYMDRMHRRSARGTAAYTLRSPKRFRKWGGIPTGITVNGQGSSVVQGGGEHL